MQDTMKQVRYKQWAQMVVDRKNSGMYRSSAFVTLMTKKFTDYQRFSLL